MIISHGRKFIFLRVPKNGSSTTQVLLADSGLVDEGDLVTFVKGISFEPTSKRMGHATIEQMMARNYITPDILAEYEIVITLRNPIDRFKSAYLFLNSPDAVGAEHYRNEILNSDVVNYKGLQNQKSFCFYKDVLQIATIFDFHNLYDDVSKFIIGKGKVPIPEITLKKQDHPEYITDMPRGLMQVLEYKLKDEIDHYNEVMHID